MREVDVLIICEFPELFLIHLECIIKQSIPLCHKCKKAYNCCNEQMNKKMYQVLNHALYI